MFYIYCRPTISLRVVPVPSVTRSLNVFWYIFIEYKQQVQTLTFLKIVYLDLELLKCFLKGARCSCFLFMDLKREREREIGCELCNNQ